MHRIPVSLLALALACQREAPTRSPSPAGREIDIGAIVQRAPFRFRSEGADFVARGRAWRVRVTGDAMTLAAEGAAPVTFRTLGPASDSPSMTGDGAVRIARSPEIVETIEHHREGIEQSWTFERRPSRALVEIGVSGQTYAGATALGLHFIDPATGIGTRYGTAWWIDAAGTKTRVDPVWTGDRIRIEVPPEVASRSAYPAILDPTISAEIGTDIPLVRTARDLDSEGRVASGAGVHLIVWSEQAETSTIGYEARGARVRASDGALLDPRPIQIATRSSGPVVSFDGNGTFLVSYNTLLPSGFRGISVQRIRASDGGLDGAPSPVSAIDRGGTLASAFGDGRLLVAWSQDELGQPNIYARMVDAVTGQVGTDDMVIASDSTREFDPSVCFSNGNFLVGYSVEPVAAPRAMVARRVRASDAAVLDAGGLPISDSPSAISHGRCAGNATHLLVAWSLVSGGIQMRRVEAATGTLDPASVPMATGPVARPTLAYDASTNNFLAVWSDILDVRGKRIAPDLSFLDGPLSSPGIPIATSTTSEGADAVSAADGMFYAVWSDFSNRVNLFGRRVRASDAAVLDPVPPRFTSNANAQLFPGVAFGGGNYLVAWYDERGSPTYDRLDVVGVRVRASDGAVLDPNGITILEDMTYPFDAPPGIASDGATFLVAAHRRPISSFDTSIVARRVRASDGAVLDTSDIVIDPPSLTAYSGKRTAVAFGGTAFIVVFPRFTNDASLGVVSRQLISRRVDPATGTVVGSETLVANDPSRVVTYPAIACEAQSCMVAWLAGTSPTNLRDVLSARVHAFTGGLLDPTPFVLVPIPGNFFSTTLAFGAADYFVLWKGAGGMSGRRVATNGSILGAPEVSITGAAGARQPRIAFDGTDFVVAWSNVPPPGLDVGCQIWSTRVLSPSTVLDPSGIFVGNTGLDTDDMQPGVASDRAGRTLIVHTRFDDRPEIFSERVVARLFTNLPLGTPCAGHDDCASAFCVDGVCCNEACGLGATDDCQVCSAAAGSAGNDGICDFRPATQACRGSNKMCDPIEYCTGSAFECPPDVISGGCQDAGPPDADMDSGEPPDGGAIDSDAEVVADADVDADASNPDADLADVDLADTDLVGPDAFFEPDTGHAPNPDASGVPDAIAAEEDDPTGCGCTAAQDRSRSLPIELLLAALLLVRRSRPARITGTRGSCS